MGMSESEGRFSFFTFFSFFSFPRSRHALCKNTSDSCILRSRSLRRYPLASDPLRDSRDFELLRSKFCVILVYNCILRAKVSRKINRDRRINWRRMLRVKSFIYIRFSLNIDLIDAISQFPDQRYRMCLGTVTGSTLGALLREYMLNST